MRKKIFFYILLPLVFMTFSLWFISRADFVQNKLRLYAATSLEKALGTHTSVGAVELAFPFIKMYDVVVQNENASLSIDKISCVPLWIDLPFKRLSLISLKARGIELKGNPEKLLGTTDEDPFSLSIFSFKLISLHFSNPHIPGSSFDGSLKGRLHFSPASEHLNLHATLTRSSPTCWPKRLKIHLVKEKSHYDCSGSLFLNGAFSRFIGPTDRLDWNLHATKGAAFFQKIFGTWKLHCPTDELPLVNNFVTKRMLHANGTISYEDQKALSIYCEDLSCSMIFGKVVHVQTDVEGSGTTLLQYGKPLTFQAKLSLESTSPDLKGRTIQFRAPTFTCNTFSGSLEGIVHLFSDETSFSLFSKAEGNLFSGSKGSPIELSSNLSFTGEASSFSTNLIIEPFQLSTKVENTDASSASWASFRCQDLSSLQQFLPLPLAGEGEITFSRKKSDTENILNLSSHFSHATLGPVSCQNADVTLSSQNFLEKVNATIDVMAGKFLDLSLDTAHINLAATPKTWQIELPELRLVGITAALPFDLSGSGAGTINGTRSLITLNELNGTLHGEKIFLERPAQFECYDFDTLLSQGLFSFRVGETGTLKGQWIHSTPSRSSLELGWRNLPFHIMATLFNITSSSGSVSGECHYKTTPRNMIGSFQMQANVTRCGALGNPDGSLDLEAALSLSDDTLNGTTSVRGSGVIEPILSTFSLPIQRVPKTPFFTFSADRPLSATLQGKAAISKLFYYWMPDEIGCEAVLSMNAAVGGSLNDIQAKGPVVLNDGRMELLATGQVLENVEMEGLLDQRHLTIHSIKASDAQGGTLSGVGSIDFSDPFSWQTALVCSDLEVVNLPFTNVTADGTLHLKGTAHDLLISGSATAKKAFLDVAARFPTNIPELPVTFCGEQKNEKTPFMTLFDLHVDAPTGGKIRGRGLNTEWKGYLHLVGPATKLRLEGLVDCTKGTFTLAGKELSISRGMIVVGGNLFTDSRLNVLANVSLPSISVQVGLKGSLKDPKFFIQSTPALPEKEVLSLLLFNKEYGDISPLESLQLANAALTLEQSSGPFELIDRVKSTFGIDLIDIGSSSLTPHPISPWTTIGADSEESEGPLPAPQNDVTLKVGKYISSGVAVTVSKDISAGVNRIGLEAAITQHVTAQAEVGDDAGGIASLKWKKDY